MNFDGLALCHVNCSFKFGSFISVDSEGTRTHFSSFNKVTEKNFGFCTIKVMNNSNGATVEVVINETGKYIIQGNITVYGADRSNINNKLGTITSGQKFTMKWDDYNASCGVVVVRMK